jgi:hypothetical protein
LHGPTTTILRPHGKDRWRGEVIPLDDEWTLYLVVSGKPDGTLGTFIRNPDRNIGDPTPGFYARGKNPPPYEDLGAACASLKRTTLSGRTPIVEWLTEREARRKHEPEL